MARRRLNLRANSRARYSSFQYLGDWEWFGFPDYPDFPPADDDDFVEMRFDTKVDTLAYDTYGDAALLWVILMANDIDLWPSDVPIGATLRLPSKTRVDSILKKARRG
jgi:hypothetical protein